MKRTESYEPRREDLPQQPTREEVSHRDNPDRSGWVRKYLDLADVAMNRNQGDSNNNNSNSA